MPEISCPGCGSPEYYTLSDRRLQCVCCRKKYSTGNRRNKLTLPAIQAIAKSFWEMIPASAASVKQGVNSKTVQKCYDTLRRNIAELNERYILGQIGATTIGAGLFADVRETHRLTASAEPIFCLVRVGDKVFFLSVECAVNRLQKAVAGPNIVGWVYARDHEALVSLDLDRIHFLPVLQATVTHNESRFWIHSKHGLVRYHGGFRKNFTLFMREMEFRFNNQYEDSGLDVLVDMLQKDRNS